MIIELKIEDFGSFVELVTRLNDEQNYRMWYRGQSNYLWGLVPSVQRKKNMGEHYEQYITTNFMIQTMRLNPNAPQRYNRAAWLTLMQHYGLPTRLLDITRNLLVALFFACESQPETYGELILIAANHQEIKYPQSDTVSILASLPVFSAQKQREFFSLASDAHISSSQFNTKIARLIHEVRLEKPAFQPEINKNDVLNSYIVYALKNNNRIVKQDGAFILCGLDNQYGFLEKFRYREHNKKVVVLIDKKKKILEQLETFSINRASLFPEIECVSEYLKNKYL